MNNSKFPLRSKFPIPKRQVIFFLFKLLSAFGSVQKSQASPRWAQYEAFVHIQGGKCYND